MWKLFNIIMINGEHRTALKDLLNGPAVLNSDPTIEIPPQGYFYRSHLVSC